MCTYSTHNICVENYAELYNYTFKILVKKLYLQLTLKNIQLRLKNPYDNHYLNNVGIIKTKKNSTVNNLEEGYSCLFIDNKSKLHKDTSTGLNSTEFNINIPKLYDMKI